MVTTAIKAPKVKADKAFPVKNGLENMPLIVQPPPPSASIRPSAIASVWNFLSYPHKPKNHTR